MAAEALRERWSALATRERRFVVAGGLVVAAALANVLLWQPVVADLPRAEHDAIRAELRLDRARAAALAAGTRNTTPAREPVDVAVRAALARAGVASSDATLDVDAGRATLVLASVRFETLVALVDALAHDAAVHVVDATFTARVEPGRVRAELSLAR
jgi:type II secretory pathway component PulM